jgi:LacI family transcriptional regulator, galactose operon repressor
MVATIKDVAKKAQVSAATVSLVIHDHQRISSDTKRKVRKAIEDLDYHPVRSARDLALQKSGNIGFVVSEDHFSRSEPFYTQIFLGTEFQARESEYYVLLTSVKSDFNTKSKLPRFILERNVEGVILAGKIPQCLIDNLSSLEIPMVFVDYYPSQGNFPVVMIDNISGGMKATQHLIDCQRRKIAFIAGDISHPSISERFQGYKMALEKNNLPYDSDLVVIDEPYPAREFGYRAAQKLLQNKIRPTAIFACNDAMSIGVLKCLKEMKIEIPKDISIIGFDDVEADLSMDPPLTTIRVPKVEMGMEAIKLMTEILRQKQTGSRKILVPVELIVRSSTCEL